MAYNGILNFTIFSFFKVSYDALFSIWTQAQRKQRSLMEQCNCIWNCKFWFYVTWPKKFAVISLIKFFTISAHNTESQILKFTIFISHDLTFDIYNAKSHIWGYAWVGDMHELVWRNAKL